MSPELFKVFGEALAIGLLVGAERYKDRDPGEERFAGIRTFALISVLGAVCALIDAVVVTGITLGGLVLLIAVVTYRSPAGHVGLTTELAAVLTFWLGYLVGEYEALSIGVTIVVVIFLASKKTLHGFVKGAVTDAEFFHSLKFLAIVFVVLPLLPDRELGPYGFFNPALGWKLVILVSAIAFAGYILIRVMGPVRGLGISALVGGLVSTTAVTMSLADRARKAPEASRLCSSAGILANSVQGPRLLLLLWVVDRQLTLAVAWPLAAMFVTGAAIAWLLWRFRSPEHGLQVDLLLQNPFSLRPALKFALLIVAIFFLSSFAVERFGEHGLLAASAISGVANVSAISLSLAKLTGSGSLGTDVAVRSLFLALAANMAFKVGLAALYGNRSLAGWLAAAFATMLAAGFTAFLLS